MSKKTYMKADPTIDPVTGVVMDTPDVEIIDRVPSKLPTRGFAPLVRREVIARSADDGRTQDWYREETDINRILDKFRQSGDPQTIRNVKDIPPEFFYDLPEGMDYQNAMIQVSKAESAFMDLPSKMRAKFENDPRIFLDALNDPANKDYFVAEGLLRDTTPPTPPKKSEGPPAPSKETQEASPPA